MNDNDMYQQRPQRNPMATAAIMLGIIALLSCSAFYIAFPCGSLAVICAVLSRGRRSLTGKSKAAIVCGILGMAASAVITFSTVRMVFTDPSLRSDLESMLQLYTGDFDFDLDEELEKIFPFFNGDSDHEIHEDEDSDDFPTIPHENDSSDGRGIFL